MSQSNPAPDFEAKDIVLARLADRLSYATVSEALVIRYASDNFLKILGQPAQPEQVVVGELITAVLPELAGMEESLAQVLTGQLSHLHINGINRPNLNAQAENDKQMSPRFIDYHIQRMEGNLLIFVEDVTALNRLRQQAVQERNELRLIREELSAANYALKTLNQLKTLFFAIITHDLKTPLTSVRGYADLMIRRNKLDERDLRFAQLIVGQSMWLNTLIQDLLDLNHLEQNTLKFQQHPEDLNQLLHKAIGDIHYVCHQWQINLKVMLPEEPLPVLADKRRLRQTLYHLLDTAVRITQEGDTVSLQLTSISEHEAQFELIATASLDEFVLPQTIEEVYALVEQSQHITNYSHALAMFIISQIIRAHGGRFTATTEDQHTKYTLIFPLHQTQ